MFSSHKVNGANSTNQSCSGSGGLSLLPFLEAGEDVVRVCVSAEMTEHKSQDRLHIYSSCDRERNLSQKIPEYPRKSYCH
jgi:hypothetical protein